MTTETPTQNTNLKFYVLIILTGLSAALSYITGQGELTEGVIVAGALVGIMAALHQWETNPPSSPALSKIVASPPRSTFTIPDTVKYLIGFCLGFGLLLNAIGLFNDWTILHAPKAFLAQWQMSSYDPEIAGVVLIAFALTIIALDIILPEEEGKTPS